MLKITKKIKKKHKHKRGKDQELFTAEELEQYKREQAEKARQAAAEVAEDEGLGSCENTEEVSTNEEYATACASTEPAKEEGNDEWQKFKALTAGVDDILKKSQGDLGRIKSTSYYQRKPPGPSSSETESKKPKPARPAAPVVPTDKRWVGFEEGAPRPEDDTEEVEDKEVPVPPQCLEEAAEEPFTPEEEEPEDDGLFDTSYVDVVTSGEIKLAYIPDSPPAEAEDEDDPFDTSIVDKVIKPTEIITKDGKKKTLVSLGCAVDVLTGLLDKAVPTHTTVQGAKKRRVIQRDLLLDDNANSTLEDLPAVTSPEGFISKSLLDEEADQIPEDLPIDLPIVVTQPVTTSSIVSELNNEQSETESKPDFQNLLDEFDVISEAALDTEEVLVTPAVVHEESDDEFAVLAAECVLKHYDPFDTSAAEVALGGEASKPKIPSTQDVDVLLRSESPSTDLTLKKHPPIRPPPPKAEQENEVDPFDTSYAENLVPGQLELKIIENEILGNLKDEDDDFDFDPRAGEIPASPVSSVTIKVSAPAEDIPLPESEDIPEPVPLEPLHRDLLGGSNTDLSTLAHDPIEPAVENAINIETEDFDPFDTSAVTVLAPGKAELRLLEQELLTTITNNQDLEDEDFNPRASDSGPISAVVYTQELPSPSSRPDLLAGEEDIVAVSKPLSPVPCISEEDNNIVDPFDTTFAENIAPGKAELRVIENELVYSISDDEFDPRQEIPPVTRRYSEITGLQIANAVNTRRFSDVTGDIKQTPPDSLPFQQVAKSPTDQPDLLAVVEEDEAPHKPLTPTQEFSKSNIVPDDPFDTSQISPALVPGPAELRQLENELRIDEPPAHLSRSYSDPDFNPREDITKEQARVVQQDIFQVSEEGLEHAIKPLSPQVEIQEEKDPFDTSFAGDLVPGRAEIKLLEAELIGK